MISRRDLLCASAGVALPGLPLPGIALAQAPKLTRVIVGFPPGGGTDVVARTLVCGCRPPTRAASSWRTSRVRVAGWGSNSSKALRRTAASCCSRPTSRSRSIRTVRARAHNGARRTLGDAGAHATAVDSARRRRAPKPRLSATSCAATTPAKKPCSASALRSDQPPFVAGWFSSS